jgi:DNA-3-methyladenine glycosylase
MNLPMKLPSSFYLHYDVCELSRFLLGKIFVSNIDGVRTSGIIVETEAYEGVSDKASHAYNNRRTKRTETLYKKGGVLYVYQCYGIHYLTNIVTNQAEVPHAILIRAIEPLEGMEVMLQRLQKKSIKRATSGPGLVSKAMGINKSHDSLSLQDSLVFIEDRGNTVYTNQIVSTTRIGVEYAGAHAKWKYRFFIKGNLFVSKY